MKRVVTLALVSAGLFGCASDGTRLFTTPKFITSLTSSPEDDVKPLSKGLETQMNRYVQQIRVGSGSLFTDMSSLSAFGHHAVEPVQSQLLAHSDERVRSNAVFVLSEIYRLDGSDEALAAVRGSINDEAPLVRLEAARALLEFGDEQGVPVLIDGLRSPNRSVRFNSLFSLRDASGSTFGYNPDDDPSSRERAIGRFETWHRG